MFDFLECDRELNSQVAFIATLMSLWTDTRHNSVLLTKTEARTGVTMMMINMEDSNDCSEAVERQQRQATFKHVI